MCSPFTRVFITPYCWLNGISSDEKSRFTPPNDFTNYDSFSSFFIRKLSDGNPKGAAPFWPCDGKLVDCYAGPIRNTSKVKKDRADLSEIFLPRYAPLSRNEAFLNIFLSNVDYHRVHSPIDGRIVRVTVVPGKLVVLRSWSYGEEPSYPAMTNSRINIEISQSNGDTWYMSLVSGPGVAEIHIDRSVLIGSRVSAGQEIAHFKIGSTVCIIVPLGLDGRDQINLSKSTVRANTPMLKYDLR